MTTTAEILQKARDLISDEKNWTQCANARNENGEVLFDAYQDDAFSFCSFGAIQKVCKLSRQHAVVDVVRQELSGGHSIVSFNDTHRHAEVLDLFDRAIKRAISAEEAA